MSFSTLQLTSVVLETFTLFYLLFEILFGLKLVYIAFSIPEPLITTYQVVAFSIIMSLLVSLVVFSMTRFQMYDERRDKKWTKPAIVAKYALISIAAIMGTCSIVIFIMFKVPEWSVLVANFYLPTLLVSVIMLLVVDCVTNIAIVLKILKSTFYKKDYDSQSGIRFKCSLFTILILLANTGSLCDFVLLNGEHSVIILCTHICISLRMLKLFQETITFITIDLV